MDRDFTENNSVLYLRAFHQYSYMDSLTDSLLKLFLEVSHAKPIVFQSSNEPSPTHTASHVAQTSWRTAEDMGNHDQGRPGSDLRTASFRPHTMETGLDESVEWVRTGPPSLECFRSRRGQRDW